MFKKFFNVAKSMLIDSHKNLSSTKSIIIVAVRCAITVISYIAFLCTHKLKEEVKECCAIVSAFAGMFWAFH